MPNFLGFDIEKKTSKLKNILFVIENSGIPMPMVEIDFLEYAPTE